MSDNNYQPKPLPGKQDVAVLVIKDIEERIEFGRAKYGTVLQTFNGRNALIDAYQEVLDLVIYLKQKILEENELSNVE